AALVGSTRKSSIRIVNRRAPGEDEFTVEGYTDPDIVSTDAVYLLQGATGKRRNIALRGLRDADVVRTNAGLFAPSAALTNQVNVYIGAVNNLGWQIRYQNRPPTGGLFWYPVRKVEPHTSNVALSICTLDLVPPVITTPTPWIAQGVPKDDIPGFP